MYACASDWSLGQSCRAQAHTGVQHGHAGHVQQAHTGVQHGQGRCSGPAKEVNRKEALLTAKAEGNCISVKENTYAAPTQRGTVKAHQHISTRRYARSNLAECLACRVQQAPLHTCTCTGVQVVRIRTQECVLAVTGPTRRPDNTIPYTRPKNQTLTYAVTKEQCTICNLILTLLHTAACSQVLHCVVLPSERSEAIASPIHATRASVVMLHRCTCLMMYLAERWLHGRTVAEGVIVCVSGTMLTHTMCHDTVPSPSLMQGPIRLRPCYAKGRFASCTLHAKRHQNKT